MANFLVTGGAGFIGSNIVEALVERGESVRVLDNFATGKRENIAPFVGKIELIEGSLSDLETCRCACDDIDFVLHQGAIPSVPRSVADPVGSHEANVTGTQMILLAARDKGVKRLVYAASSSAYGNTPVSPKVETLTPLPLSPYAAQKLAGEYYCRAFTEVYGLETVSLRYFNVFGPRQDPESQYAAVIPKFITSMMQGQKPPVYGDGTQSRDFTYVANNVEANLLAAKAPRVSGEIINIACGESIGLIGLIGLINDILGTDLKPDFKPARVGDVKHSLADVRKARELLAYSPRISFKEGLKKTIEWFRRGELR
ncbi:MAG: SDR family oxidoreductase [bacterium]